MYNRKHMFKNIHSGTIYKNKRLEMTQMPLAGQWIDNLWNTHTMRYTTVKRNVLYPYHSQDGSQYLNIE